MNIVRNRMHVWESHLYKFKRYKKLTFCKKVQLYILITVELLLGMEGEGNGSGFRNKRKRR